jgi:FtsZ-binding cell division protein ZapB
LNQGGISLAKEKSCHKFIYKLPSKRLSQASWNLNLPIHTAIKNKNDVVALSDSQLLRWICELNGIKDLDLEVRSIQSQIKHQKKLPKSEATKNKIRELYKKLYSLQYQKDYVCIIMNTKKDYLRANKGFTINQSPYRRLMGTNGGIKKSTITYVGDSIYDEIKKRMDNGRNLRKPLIPAKLEAYQALICSSSIPVTMPRIAIVNDCVVTFKEDVILIQDGIKDEPEMTREKDYEITYCDSDGYGLMSPEYSIIVNRDLHGESSNGESITGINTRFAWTKGMLFTFDLKKFAKEVNQENYTFYDAWGTSRDVRNYDVILTTSMVKLWDSYDSLEHFLQCSLENHYEFSVSKTTPSKLEHVRNANYQFLQTFEFTEEELYELCEPTIREIKDVLFDDWRKTIVFLKGMHLNESQADSWEHDFIKALMIDKRMAKDPFVVGKIYNMIRKRIQMAAKGSIKLTGNFAIVSGDPYTLAQSIFGLPVTGLLKPGEVYHSYWKDRGVKEIACFRAPMTCHNNIRRRKVVHNPEMDDWYQYNQTGMILNSWDTTCDALNGADKDSDAFFTTDHPIIVRNTKNAPTIECVQRRADTVIPEESHFVQANILAFGDEIGATTNKITVMIELQSGYHKDSQEYKELDYRIMCGQHYQQNSIDKAKGILSKPMTKHWYNQAACKKLAETNEEEKRYKELCLRICAHKKPYFMKYIYPDLMTEYKSFINDSNKKSIRMFQMSIEELMEKQNLSIEEMEFLKYHQELLPVGNRPCTVNQICWLFEKEFQNILPKQKSVTTFDYTILKSGASYNKNDYKKIEKVKAEYDLEVKSYQCLAKTERLDKDEVSLNRTMLILKFKAACEAICPNEKELCDILLDLCYTTSKSKQFVWDVCGETIINNLLEKNYHTINYPVRTSSQGEFEFAGESFVMKQRIEKGDEQPLLF